MSTVRMIARLSALALGALLASCGATQTRSVLECSLERSDDTVVSVAEALASPATWVEGVVVSVSDPCPVCPPEASCDPCEELVTISDDGSASSPQMRLGGLRDVTVGHRYVFHTAGSHDQRSLLDCRALDVATTRSSCVVDTMCDEVAEPIPTCDDAVSSTPMGHGDRDRGLHSPLSAQLHCCRLRDTMLQRVRGTPASSSDGRCGSRCPEPSISEP